MATVEQQLAAARALIAKAAAEAKPSTAAKAVPTLEERLTALQEENARLKAAATRATTISLKVGEKGGLSVYGLGRFPVTLYKGQWLRLIASSDKIAAFIAENDAVLAEKPVK